MKHQHINELNKIYRRDRFIHSGIHPGRRNRTKRWTTCQPFPTLPFFLFPISAPSFFFAPSLHSGNGPASGFCVCLFRSVYQKVGEFFRPRKLLSGTGAFLLILCPECLDPEKGLPMKQSIIISPFPAGYNEMYPIQTLLGLLPPTATNI